MRHHDKIQPVDRRQSRWGLSVVTLAHMKGRALVRRLRQDGILQKWEHQECPHCAQGALSELYFDRYKKVWAHRCSKRGCQARVQPHDFHPIFFCGSGSSHTPLGMQAAILFCALANVPVSSVPALLDIHRKPVEKIYSNLEVARARCVQQKERLIVYGAKRTWADVEADEVDLGKEELVHPRKGGTKVQWEQWGGMVERGCPETLVLYRLRPKLTAKRSPGPGPITRRDWAPIAARHLKDREVILHTDRARAYKMKINGVIHDNVVHKKKKVIVKGKARWVKPHYTKVYVHKLPNGKEVKVRAGTQIIDRFWGMLRQTLRNIPQTRQCTSSSQDPIPAMDLLAPRTGSMESHWCYAAISLLPVDETARLLSEAIME